MECTKYVKEYEMNIDNDVIFTDDLPVKWVSTGVSGDQNKFKLRFTFRNADAGVDLHSVGCLVDVQGEYFTNDYYATVMDFDYEDRYWCPLEDGRRDLKWSETEKEVTLSFSTKISANFTPNMPNMPNLPYMHEIKYMFRKKVKITLAMFIPKLSSIPLSGYKFTEKNEARDQILVVGDKKFYVNKAVISHYSPFFNSLFNNKNFKESKQAEIELKDLVSEEFEVLLQVIHPSDVTVNADNIEFLWKLADRFGVTCVAEMCEEFISNIEGKGTGAFSLANRMKMAQLYNSEKLMASLLKQIEKL